jgi:UDP-glucose 4-epimerase
VSVHDVAAANLLALTDTRFEWGDVHDVATGRSVSLDDVLDAFQSAARRPVERFYGPARVGDVLHSASRSRKLRSFGWEPSVSLQNGLGELLIEAIPRAQR